jgi:hypothetical protein
MGWTSELERQGRWGIVNLVLAILAFFDLTAGGFLAHISRDLPLTVIGVLFSLSTIITFVSRRQISTLSDKISVVELQSKDAELRAIKAKDNADKKINEMRIQFEKELVDCRGHYTKLLNAYSAVVEKMKQDQLKATYGIKAQNKSTNYVLDEPLFYKPFPEDDLLNEAKEWTKEWDEHCT